MQGGMCEGSAARKTDNDQERIDVRMGTLQGPLAFFSTSPFDTVRGLLTISPFNHCTYVNSCHFGRLAACQLHLARPFPQHTSWKGISNMFTNSPCRRRPTHTTSLVRVTPSVSPEAKRLLSDMAFVLHLTSRVKGQMMADCESNPSSLALASGDDCF